MILPLAMSSSVMASKTRFHQNRHPLDVLQTTDGQGISNRPARVAEIIRHHLADFLLRTNFHHQDLADSHLITVSEVSLSPDLKNARILVYPLHHRQQSPADFDKKIAALNKVSGFLRSMLAKKMTQKTTPALTFVIDKRFDSATNIDKILAQHTGTESPE